MKEPIVVLNSGGFDSITLVNWLHKTEPEYDIHSLHFLYGAPNEQPQLLCVEKVCSKLGISNRTITLPPFDWTHSQFYNRSAEWDKEDQYLEYRNLVFLAYAVSYAQSVGAHKIFAAVFKGTYSDTCPTFIQGLNSALSISGIEIMTPFAEYEDKTEIVPLAVFCGVKKGDYFSCDKPQIKDGVLVPCEVCADCLDIKDIEDFMRIDHPFKALYQSGFNYQDPEFVRLLAKNFPGREVRALINNDCQLRCSHCFYGFDQMTSPAVDRETYYATLKDLVLNHGFTNIHFSGKEPLFDDTLLWYAQRIKEDNLPCTFNVVTNGINVPKYAAALKSFGCERVFLSVDDVLNTQGVRSVSNVTDRALKACFENDLTVEVFLDLHQNNVTRVGDIVNHLYSCGVKRFFVRTIRSLGNASEQVLLSGEDLFSVFQQLETIAKDHEGIFINYSLSGEYIPVIKDTLLQTEIDILDSCYDTYHLPNMVLHLERYCARYNDITITPDGYVLGCASEVARPDYASISVGNIKDTSIADLLALGDKRRCCDAHLFPEKNFSCMANKLGQTT